MTDDAYDWGDPKGWGEQMTDLWDNRDKTVPPREQETEEDA